MPTCFCVSNSIGLAATPLYMVERSVWANNSIVNALDSMEFYMAGSTSGLGRRPLKAETCVRITYLSPIWPLGQGKVARLSGGRRWLVCRQQSPLPIAQLQCVKSNVLMQVGHSFGVFQPSGIMLVELTWKISKRHASNASLIRLCYGRVCGRVLCTSNINLQLGSLTWKIPRIFTEHLSTNGEVATRWVYFAGGSAIPASVLWPRRRIG